MSKKQSTARPADKPAEEQAQPEDLFEIRLEKLNTLLEAGENPYLQSYNREHTLDQALVVPEDQFESAGNFVVAGRVKSRRMMGKAGFMDIEDETGRIQLYGAQKTLNSEDKKEFDLFKTLDMGDIIGVTGELFKTKTGQTSLRLSKLTLLAKCLRPLPTVKEVDGKRIGAFSDKEQRYRMRYVDLLVNPDVKENFVVRSRVITYIRNFLIERGYLEVETPMMHPIPGGAAARPFKTHHNALDMELYLRIAPELYLKRLLVGGFNKVFEINRNFRNEGISFKHNPEFTMLELYEAYGNMDSMLETCESLISGVTQEVCGKTVIPYGENEIDLTPPWEKLTFCEVIEKHSGAAFNENMSLDEAKAVAVKAGLKADDLEDCTTIWQVAEWVFDEKVEHKLIQPVFVTHYPVELSPLAKVWSENPAYVERFEPFMAGRELANAFSELNDPIDQKARFQAQVDEREAGGEGGYMDLDYVRALEYGMPPAGGMGIGIDRLVMLLTNSHTIRDSILFPLMRPEKGTDVAD